MSIQLVFIFLMNHTDSFLFILNAQHGIMGVVVFIVKQQPLLIKSDLPDSCWNLMFYIFIHVKLRVVSCVLPGYVSPVPLGLLQWTSCSSILGTVAAASSHPDRGGLLGLRWLRGKSWKTKRHRNKMLQPKFIHVCLTWAQFFFFFLPPLHFQNVHPWLHTLIIAGLYCVHNNTPEDDKESLYSLATCTHTSYANDKQSCIYISIQMQQRSSWWPYCY